jgi:hypothetical protein
MLGLYIAVIAFTLTVGGCSDVNPSLLSGLSSSSGSTSTAASATGIWAGTDSDTGLKLTGLINSGGRADFIRQDGAQYAGTVQVSGGTLIATLDGSVNFGGEFADTSTHGVGTLNATVSTATSIIGTLTFTSSAGSSYPGSWSLGYDSLSTVGSSLSAISGSYTDAAIADINTGASMTISTGGVISGRGAANGCAFSGTMATNDSSIDVYEVSYTYSSCTGSYAVLNNVPFSGLAVFDTTSSPMQLIIGVTGQSAAGTQYGLASVLSHD